MNPASDITDRLQVRVGPQRFTLPLDTVRDVIEPAALTVVPLAPPELLGLAIHRGQAVAIYSLAGLVGQQVAAGAKPDMAVICTAQGQVCGFAVDSVADVAGAGNDTDNETLLDVFALLDAKRAAPSSGDTV